MQEIEILQLLKDTLGLPGVFVFAFSLVCCLGPSLATQDLLDLNQTTPINISGMQQPNPAQPSHDLTSNHLTSPDQERRTLPWR